MVRKATGVVVSALGLLVFALPGAAHAGSASTPVGQLTAAQVACDDPGAYVKVTISGGFPNTSYSAKTDYPSGLNTPSSLTTNASGAGTVTVGYGWFSGTHSVVVTARGTTGSVTYEANCDSGWGD